MVRSHNLIRTLLTVLIALAWVNPLAQAQSVPVEPYYAVTTRDDVPLKSGELDWYYNIALLERGAVVRVDAEGDGWARVVYPFDLPVYLRASDVRVEEDEVVVTRRVQPKSVNQSGGFGSSWQPCMPRGEFVESGTRLPVYSQVQDRESGEPLAFATAPPAGARAYLRVDALRAATQSEIDTYLAGVPDWDLQASGSDTDAETADPVDPDPTDSAPADSDPSTPDDDTGGDATDTPAADQAASDDGSLLEPITRPGEEGQATDLDPIDPDPTEPVDAQVPDATPEDGSSDQPALIEQGEPTDPNARMVGTIRQLSELFNQVQAQDSDTAELDELAAEFRRAIAAQGDDQIGLRTGEALGQRLDLVEMRIEARDVRRELRARREAIDRRYADLENQIRQLETTRGYQFVGRLVRSSVYNGNRLPLMYRIVSVNESVPRTIGYIAPSAAEARALGVSTKLGEIVGVLGASTLDPDLNLRIVDPVRIDVLAPEGLVQPAGTGS